MHTTPSSAMRCWLTSAAAQPHGMAEQGRLAPAADTAGGSGLPRIWVDATRRFQTLQGFGGAFTEAAAVTWQALDAQRRAGLPARLLRPAAPATATRCAACT